MSHHPPITEKPVTVPDILAGKKAGRKLVVVTAYDYPTAQLLDEAGVDILLVGDSLGMVVQGNPHCLTVTLDDMVYHSRLVSRAARRSLVVSDLPFMTFQLGPQHALESAGRLVQQGGAHAVKLEGGERSARAIEAILAADIPVMGHVGLTPQSLHRLGGFRVQRDPARLLADAQAVQAAGAFAVVVEGVPAELGRRITEAVAIPTIGIGAGAGCDGQVLVFHDLLNYGGGKRPKFVKQYGDLSAVIKQAAAAFGDEVRAGTFPGPEQTYS
jgi:3-methyl-2-oxobutanoate hydroxymethyltransferase